MEFKKYNHLSEEKNISQYWEKKGFFKPPKIIKPKIDKVVIQNKRDEINRQIQKVLNSGLSEKRRNTQIENLQNQLPKDDEDLSKEY